MLKLETFDEESFEVLMSWIESEEQLMQFAGPSFSFPLTKEQLKISLSNSKRLAFKVMDSTTGSVIGHCEIYLTDQSVYLGKIIIGNKDLRGKGLGQQIVQLLLSYAFEKLNQTKVELNVFDWNIPAIKCYEKVGFVVNPDKKNERQIKNETWTAINMEIDKTQWEKLKQYQKW